MAIDDVTYWAARAAEERRLASSLPDGAAALIHLQLAELYELSVRDGKPAAGSSTQTMKNPQTAPVLHRGRPGARAQPICLGEDPSIDPFPGSEAW